MCTKCYTSNIWHTQVLIRPNNEPIDKDKFVLCRACGELVETGMVSLSEHYNTKCKGIPLSALMGKLTAIENDYLIEHLFDTDDIGDMIKKLKEYFIR